MQYINIYVLCMLDKIQSSCNNHFFVNIIIIKFCFYVYHQGYVWRFVFETWHELCNLCVLQNIIIFFTTINIQHDKWTTCHCEILIIQHTVNLARQVIFLLVSGSCNKTAKDIWFVEHINILCLFKFKNTILSSIEVLNSITQKIHFHTFKFVRHYYVINYNQMWPQ